MGRNKRFTTAGAVLLFALGLPSVIQAGTLYVDANAVGLNNGSSWVNAYRFLQDALANAKTAEKPVEIRTAQGVYKPDRGAGQKPGDRLASFDLFSGVALQGGYAGLGAPDPNVRDAKLYETILSGDLAGNDAQVRDPCDLQREPTRSENCCNVIEIVDANDVRLEGLTITGGQANVWSRADVGLVSTTLGAGVYAVRSQALAFKDCTLTDNLATDGMSGGGACYIGDCVGLTIEACSIIHNAGVASGGLSV
jgi:hypothetical protein